MKKLFLFVLSAFFISTNLMAWEKVSLSVCDDYDNTPVGHGYGKSPIQAPTVYIEDYTLAFVADHPDYILNIKDEDGEVVFSTPVYTTETQVVLPSTLSGDYEIELIMGNWKFIGWINI